MKTLVRYIPHALMLIIAGALVAIFLRNTNANKGETLSAVRPRETRVMVSDVRTIMKLVMVKGSFEEYFSEQDSRVVSGIMGNLGFGKRAMLRVKGDVTVGYDLDERNMEVDEATRTIRLRTPSDPEILAIDHHVDYLDLKAGLFNRFKADDLNALQERGRDRIKDKVTHSDLFERARTERRELTAVVRNYVESNGWTLLVDSAWSPEPKVALR